MIQTVNNKLTAINDVIRDLSGTTDKMGLDEMLTVLNTVSGSGSGSDDSYDEGYEAGIKDENERFWNLLQKRRVWVSGVGYVEEVTTNYAHRFKNFYTATEITPLYPIEIDVATSNMFESCGLIEYHPPMTFLKAVSTYAMFNACSKLKEANSDFRLTGNCSAMFNSCGELTKVNKLIIEGTVTWSTNAFAGCKKLVELNIEGVIDTAFNASACIVLNKASITNIINILSSTTSGLTCTLSKAAVNKAFETSEGANDGSASAEWNTLVNSKTNWTISLV